MSNFNENESEEIFNDSQISISRPLGEMEVIDLMIYGEDVLDSNQDNNNLSTDN